MLQSAAFSKNAESVFVSSFTFRSSFHKVSLRKPYKVRFLMEKHGRKFYKNPVLACRASCDSSETSTSRKDHTSVHGLSEMIVGVLGGGQLGRMLCQAASKMAIKVMVLDPLENCPASAISYDHMVGSFDDSATVEEFAKRCGVLTVEIEHVDVATLQKLEQQGVDCQPKASTIQIIQDKFLQKVHFSEHGIPLPEFMQIDDLEDARRAGDRFGYPLMIKSKRLAYDGRGNAVAKSEEELSSAISALGGFPRGLYVEKWAPFVKELAVIVARGRDNSILCYSVVETIHKENICHIVKAPAAVPSEIKKLANDVAYRAVSLLEGAGVFAVELFLTNDGQILLNEVAPRPHNSGHHTIESCYTSQFEQHLRAVVGLPLGDPSMKSPAAIMYNLLGEDEGERGFHLAHQLIDRALHIPGATVHWYDKSEMRKQRKMGHITIVGPSTGTVEMRLNSMLKEESSDCQSIDTPRVGIIVSSDSDLHVMKDAERVLNMFGVANEVRLVSKHQTMFSYASSAQDRGIRVIIAGDGSAAHLPGMVAALTPLPIIGVPLRASALDGIDSLLSVVQMPRGVPVATVAINNARSAGILAAKMLGVNGDVDLLARISQYLEVAGNDVLTKAGKLQKDVTPHVEIIMGSDSDLPVMKDAAKILNLFDVPHEVRIVSAHRTPELMFSFASSAQKQGTSIIIAGAGGAAHLPGMVAALTSLPVIGVPVRSSALNGIDSLLSIVQMRGDVPVATVAINNATNAGLLAVRMLAVGNADLLARMSQYMKDMKDDVLTKTAKLQEEGWESYINH